MKATLATFIEAVKHKVNGHVENQHAGLFEETNVYIFPTGERLKIKRKPSPRSLKERLIFGISAVITFLTFLLELLNLLT